MIDGHPADAVAQAVKLQARAVDLQGAEVRGVRGVDVGPQHIARVGDIGQGLQGLNAGQHRPGLQHIAAARVGEVVVAGLQVDLAGCAVLDAGRVAAAIAALAVK